MNKPNFYLDNTQIEKITPAGIKTKVRVFPGNLEIIFYIMAQKTDHA